MNIENDSLTCVFYFSTSNQLFMKHLFFFLTLVLFITACTNTDDTATLQEEISQEVLLKIANAGFSVADVKKHEAGYIVEGDIYLTEAQLDQAPSSVRFPHTEQYYTFNVVTSLPRVINVWSDPNLPFRHTLAIDAAIERYNAEGLNITFFRNRDRSESDIEIVRSTSLPSGTYARAGFPTAAGAPYDEILVNLSAMGTNPNFGFATTVYAHELGHCIGFRHSDWMNRSFSCGSGGSEGQQNTGIGAVLVPGTPAGPAANSWMLACLSNTTNRPFTASDLVALDFLY